MSPQTAKAVAPAAVTAPEPILLREDISGTAVLTLNRAEMRNTLSEAMLAALSDALSSIARDDKVHAVVLAAKGPVFCAGHDLKELARRRSDADGGRAYFKKVMTACSAMMQQIVKLPQPVIAAVQATATAAGLSACGELRPRRCLAKRKVRDLGHRCWPVLLNADGCAFPQRFAQTRDGDVGDRGNDFGGPCGTYRSSQ